MIDNDCDHREATYRVNPSIARHISNSVSDILPREIYRQLSPVALMLMPPGEQVNIQLTGHTLANSYSASCSITGFPYRSSSASSPGRYRSSVRFIARIIVGPAAPRCSRPGLTVFGRLPHSPHRTLSAPTERKRTKNSTVDRSPCLLTTPDHRTDVNTLLTISINEILTFYRRLRRDGRRFLSA